MAEEEQNETAAEERMEESADAQAEAAAAPAEAAAESGPPAPPEEQLHPKEARRRARSRHEGEARPSRTPEERQAERLALRQRKAAVRRARRQKLKTARAGQAAAAGERAGTPPREHGEGRPKVRQGVVVSDKPDKTITVRIDVARRHRRYEKIVRSTSTLHAHDERNEANAGDLVRVVECRPLSRTKRWRLVEILERAR